MRIDTVNPPENEDTSIALLADLLSPAVTVVAQDPAPVVVVPVPETQPAV